MLNSLGNISGMFIQDPDFLPSRIPGSKKHWITDLDLQHWCYAHRDQIPRGSTSDTLKVPSLKFKTLVVTDTKSQHKCKEQKTIHGKIMADLTIALDNVICCVAEYASSMEKLVKDFREDTAQTVGEQRNQKPEFPSQNLAGQEGRTGPPGCIAQADGYGTALAG
jgi:hypothetical protein